MKCKLEILTSIKLELGTKKSFNYLQSVKKEFLQFVQFFVAQAKKKLPITERRPQFIQTMQTLHLTHANGFGFQKK